MIRDLRQVRHEEEVFANKSGTTKAVVCSCGFATTYTVLSNDADARGMEHFVRMHEAHIQETREQFLKHG